MTKDEAEPLAEIRKSMLELRDDGNVFTAPHTMVGVPLEKIYPGHPYWDPNWVAIEDLVRPVLERWIAKHEECPSLGLTASSKSLANRQINRGNAILSFLKDGDLASISDLREAASQ